MFIVFMALAIQLCCAFKPMKSTGNGRCDESIGRSCLPWHYLFNSDATNREFCLKTCQKAGFNTYTISAYEGGFCETKDAYLGFGNREKCTQFLSNSIWSSYQAYCPAGKFHSSPLNCQACPQGRYNGADDYSLNECYACDTGMYQDQTSQKQCKECSKGLFQDSTAQQGCKACESGRYNYRTMRPSCDACPVGRFGTEPGVIHWQDGCKQCPIGFTQDQSGTTSCNPCTLGKYMSLRGQTNCLACPEGFAQDQTGQAECERCIPGKYTSGSNSECSNCPVGRYQPDGASSDCKVCKPGKHQPHTGQESCTECAAGKYQMGFGETSCLACPDGKASASGAPSCCGAGMYTDTSAKCYQCAPGFFTPTSQRAVRDVKWYRTSEREVEFSPRRQDTDRGAFFADDLVDVLTVQTFLPFTAPFDTVSTKTVVVSGLKQYFTYELSIYIAESNSLYDTGSATGSQYMLLNLPSIRRVCVPGKDYTSQPSKPDATTYTNPCVYTQCGDSEPVNSPVGVIELTADTEGNIEIPLEYKISNTSTDYQTCWCNPTTGDCQLGHGHESTVDMSKPNGLVETTAGVRIHLKTKAVKCIKCPADHYQDEVGQYECKSCPSGWFQNHMPIYHNYDNYRWYECETCIKEHFGLDSAKCLPKSGWEKPSTYTYPDKFRLWYPTDDGHRKPDVYATPVPEAWNMKFCTPGKEKKDTSTYLASQFECQVCSPGKFKEVVRGEIYLPMYSSGAPIHTNYYDNDENPAIRTGRPVILLGTVYSSYQGEPMLVNKRFWQLFVPQYKKHPCIRYTAYETCQPDQISKDRWHYKFDVNSYPVGWTKDYNAYAIEVRDELDKPCGEVPAGYFTAGSGNPVKHNCPIGTYQDEPGQTSCKPCKAGYYSLGASACTACPVGKWSETFLSDAREWDAPDTLVDTTSFVPTDGTTCPDKVIGRYTNSYVYNNHIKACQYSSTLLAPETDAAIIETYFTNVGPGECLGLNGQKPAHGTVENVVSFTSARKLCYELPECIAFMHKSGQTFEFYCNSPIGICNKVGEESAYRTLVGNLRAQIDGGKCPDGYIIGNSTCVFLGQSMFLNDETNACHAIRARMHEIKPGCHSKYIESCDGGGEESYHDRNGNFHGPWKQCTTFATEVCGEWSGAVPSSESACVHCPRGYFSETIGAEYRSTCRLCPAGYFTNNGGSDKCTVCPKGTYSPVIGSDSVDKCASCPVGKYQDEYAKTVPENCKLCGEGRFNPLERMPIIFACVECPYGYWSSTTPTTSCHKCSDNAITEQRGSMVEKDCKECPVGRFADTGTCIMCPKGWKISGQGCKQCPVGKRSSAVDSIECSDCIYQDESGRNKCKVCPTSHYVKNNICTKCPEGFFAEMMNSDECVSCPRGKYASNKYLTSIAECVFCPLVNYPSCYGDHVPITQNSVRYSAQELCETAASFLLNKDFNNILEVENKNLPYGCFTIDRTMLYHNTHASAPRQFMNPRHEGFCLHNMAPVRARRGMCGGVSGGPDIIQRGGGPYMLQGGNMLFGGAAYFLAEIDIQRKFPWDPLDKVSGICAKGEYGEDGGCGTCPVGKYNHVYEKEQPYDQIKTYMEATRFGPASGYMYSSDRISTSTGANGPYGILKISWGTSESGWLYHSYEYPEFPGVNFNDFTEEDCANICQHDTHCKSASWAPAYIDGAYVEKHKDTAEVYNIDKLKIWRLVDFSNVYTWLEPTLDNIRDGIWGTPGSNSTPWVSTEFARLTRVLSSGNSNPLVGTIASTWWTTMHRSSTEPAKEWVSLKRDIRNIVPDGTYSNYMAPRDFFDRDNPNPSAMSRLKHGSCFVHKYRFSVPPQTTNGAGDYLAPGFWLTCQRYGHSIRTDDEKSGLACSAHLVHSFVKTSCTNCPTGKFSSQPGTSFCHQCPNGWSSYGGALECTKCGGCPPGHGSTPDCHCETCPAGKAVSGSRCETCPAGKYSLEGAPACTQCRNGRYSDTEGTGVPCHACHCPPGTKITESSFNEDTDNKDCKHIVCEPCLSGHAQNDLNPLTECEQCGPNEYTNLAGMLTCSPCGVVCPSGYARSTLGKKSPEECENCSECSKGHYCSDIDGIERRCPRGTYQNQTGGVACKTCPMGYYSYPGKEECTLCEPMSTSDEGAGFAEHCILCRSGKFYSKPLCVDCPNGWFSNIGVDECVDCTCAKGYVRIASEDKNVCDVSCTACKIGHFCTELSSQIRCTKGMYQDQTGQTECESCPIGFFQYDLGQINCDLCPVGKTTQNISANSVDVCVQCPSGKISQGVNGCVACPDGQITDSTQGKCVFSSQFRINNIVDWYKHTPASANFLGPSRGTNEYNPITVPFATSAKSGYLEPSGYDRGNGEDLLYVWEPYLESGFPNAKFKPNKRPFICPPGVYTPNYTDDDENIMSPEKLIIAGWSNVESGREGLANVWKFDYRWGEINNDGNYDSTTGRGTCFKDDSWDSQVLRRPNTKTSCENPIYDHYDTGTWYENDDYDLTYTTDELRHTYLSLETATEGMRYKNEPYLRCRRANSEHKDEVGYCEFETSVNKVPGWKWSLGANDLKLREDTICDGFYQLSCRHWRFRNYDMYNNAFRSTQIKFWDEKSLCRCSLPKNRCQTWVEGSIEVGPNSYKSKYVTGDDELGGILYVRHFIPYITRPDMTNNMFKLGEVDPRELDHGISELDLSVYPGLIADDPCPYGYNFILETLTCEGYSQTMSSKIRCTKGTYLDQAELISLYLDQTDQTECKSCPIGFFQDDLGQNSCDLCPVGKTTQNIGANSVDVCVQCPSGYFSQGENGCLVCPDGQITDSTQGKCIIDVWS